MALSTKKDDLKEVEDKDFDKAPVSVEDQQEQMRLYMERYNTNSVSLAGDIRSKYEGEAKQKMKKGSDGEWNIPVFAEDGTTPVLKDPYLSLTIAFNGGEMQIKVNREMFDEAVMGKRYLFKGVKAMSFGSADDMFYSMVAL